MFQTQSIIMATAASTASTATSHNTTTTGSDIHGNNNTTNNTSSVQFNFVAAAKFPDAVAALSAVGGKQVTPPPPSGKAEAEHAPSASAAAEEAWASDRRCSLLRTCKVVWDSVHGLAFEALPDGCVVNHMRGMHQLARKVHVSPRPSAGYQAGADTQTHTHTHPPTRISPTCT